MNKEINKANRRYQEDLKIQERIMKTIKIDNKEDLTLASLDFQACSLEDLV